MFSNIIKFKHFRIRQKILIAVLPVLFLSYLLLLLSFYCLYVKESRNSIISSQEQVTVQLTKNITQYINNLNSNIDLLLYGTDFQSLLKKYNSDKEEYVNSFQMDCNTLFSNYLTDADLNIHRVSLLINQSEIFSNNTVYRSTIEQYGKKLQSLEAQLAQRPGELCFYYSDDEPYVVTAAKDIFDLQEPDEKIGTLLIEINLRFMDQILSKENTADYSYFSLFLDGKLIFTTSPLPDGATTQMTHQFYSSYQGENYYAIRYKLPDSLEIGVLTDTSSAFTPSNRIFFLLLLLFSCFFITIAGIIVSVSTGISHEFTLFIDKLNKTTVFDKNALIQIDTNDEFSDLAKVYNDMLLRLNNTNKQITAQQVMLKNAELEALQAQINPHFLYNTLDCISSLAAFGNNHKIIEIVPKLANIMRMSIKGPNFLTISQDILYIQQYLDIQKLRFGEKLLYLIDMDEQVQNCYIPKLIIQPIIENAIIHGIGEMIQAGYLSINITGKEDTIEIHVLNTGPACPEEIITSINTITGMKPSDNKSIGLLNVQMRIKSLFGSFYGITIQNIPEKEAVHVKILLPKIIHLEEINL